MRVCGVLIKMESAKLTFQDRNHDVLNSIFSIICIVGAIVQEFQTCEVNANSFREKRLVGRACHF